MKKIKFIEKILLNYGILKYKIIEENIFKIRNKNVSDTIKSDETKIKKIYINFKDEKHYFKLTVNKMISDESIKKLLLNTIKKHQFKEVNKKNIISFEESINNFEIFNREIYTKLIKDNIKNILKEIKLRVNSSCNLEIYNYKMLTDGKIYNQQYMHSDYFFYTTDSFHTSAYRSLNNDSKISFPSYICEQFNIYKLPKKEINLNKNILFKSNVAAELINSYISCFYGSNIYANNSFLKKNALSQTFFNFKFDLISEPFEEIIFDSEGSFTKTLYLIKDNKIENILTNQSFSKLLNLNNTGYASFFCCNNITHQNIKVISKCTSLTYPKIKTTVNFINILSFDPLTTNMTAQISFCENNEKYQSYMNINLNNLFEHSILESNICKNNGVFCGNLIFDPQIQ